MNIKDFLKERRANIEKSLAGSNKKQYLSPAIYSQYKVTLPLIKRVAHGKLIDLGCGDMPFRDTISQQVDVYDSLDIFPRVATVTYRADIQNMSMIADQMYDTGICIEVLEHVPNPFQALKEMRRILKLGGYLVLTVPHLSRLHDEPHDYYRYTKYGLEYMLSNEGFEIIELVKRGGIFSFFGHQIATLVVGVSWIFPGLRQVVWWLNSWLITRLCFAIDNVFDNSGLFALGYSLVAKRKF
jgi:SAM-dependent methyltransferase